METAHTEIIKEPLPPLNLTKENASLDGKIYLEKCAKNIEILLHSHCHAESLLSLRTKMIDKLIISLFNLATSEALPLSKNNSEKATLMAQGGYGRQEMNLHSDLDLLFIYPKKKGAYIKTLTEKLLYRLWDLGLDVGYATRTVAECKRGLFEDVTIMTSLLDARYLCGNQKLAETLLKTIRKTLKSESAQKKLIHVKLDEWKGRIEKSGGSVFMLEPHVRDSLGGLRDLQLPLWLTKIKGRAGTYEDFLEQRDLKPDDYQSLMTARNFLWRVRNELHLLVGKKVDILHFAQQETIAFRMGYQDASGILAVERFMQDYYRYAKQIASITETLIRHLTVTSSRFRLLQRFKAKSVDAIFTILDDQITLRHKGNFLKKPATLIQIFELVQDKGLPLHPETKDLIRSSLHLIDDAFRSHPDHVKVFGKILNRYQNLGMTFREMNETHVLEEFLPEFKKILCRVQHDVYHVYTVDAHSIFAVDELSRLHKGDYDDKFEKYRLLLNEISQPKLLTLGLFLHDIGKGEGGNHSIKGAVTGNAITSRLGFSTDEQKTVEFLIMSHLLMPHLSQRRDLEDQELIIQFARSMGTMDRLNMLFLLTWADIRAVGPNTWSDWKGALLERLYDKTKEVITRGEFSKGDLPKEKTRERVDRVKTALIEKVGDRFKKEEVQRFLGIMPPRYFFTVNDDEFENNLQLFIKEKDEKIAVQSRILSDLSMNELQIYTLNTPKVLAQVTGICLAYALNILKVDLFQTTDGHVFVLIGLTNAQGQAIRREDYFKELATSLKEVMFGKTKVEELIALRKVPDYLAKKPVQKARNRVAVDNDVSAYYTVIDIYAHDRLGLLFDIMQTLNQQGCYVDVSKISTKVEQVSDVFYVKDIFGKKIILKEKLAQIKEALLATLNME